MAPEAKWRAGGRTSAARVARGSGEGRGKPSVHGTRSASEPGENARSLATAAKSCLQTRGQGDDAWKENRNSEVHCSHATYHGSESMLRKKPPKSDMSAKAIGPRTAAVRSSGTTAPTITTYDSAARVVRTTYSNVATCSSAPDNAQQRTIEAVFGWVAGARR